MTFKLADAPARLLAGTILAFCVSMAASAQAVKPLVDVRVRSEHIDQDGIAEEADAVTLRARLGFETKAYLETTFLAEGELLWPLSSHYNSTTNGHTGYPVVNDPESYEINRLQLANTSLPDTTVIFGRQRVTLDDERFISRVGWRQNEQTFDALQVINKSIHNLTLDATYINQVNRVLGRESPLGRYHGDSYLANASYHTPIGDIAGFGYWLSFDEAPRDSTQTLGVRLAGERTVRKVKLTYLASYASQQEYSQNPLDFSNDFYAFELIGAKNGVSVGVGLEVLEGDGTKGFATPLATVHKFVGWADKFVTTPPDGLSRRYATLGYTSKQVRPLDSLGVTLVYHDFESNRLNTDYGHEIDAQVQGKWHKFTGVLKYANYHANAFATDTTKFWLQLEYVL